MKKGFTGLVVVCILAGLAWALPNDSSPDRAQAPDVSRPHHAQAGPSVRPAGALAPEGQPDVNAAASPLASVAPPAFHASRGHLVLNAEARTDMERTVALHERDEALSVLATATQEMPAQARREVRELYQQYVQYNQALTVAFPPGSQEQVTIEEARGQLQTLKELRAQYFGASRAKSMFGQEESMQQQLLDDAADAVLTQNLSQAKAIEYAQSKLARQIEASIPSANVQP